MNIGTLFVKRPVMTSMVFLGVTLFGFLSWTQLSQELFPNISVPQLVIITKYANAAPEEIENLITKPIEEAVGTVPNLKRVQSVSKEGISAVTLGFAWGTDMGLSHLAVREKLDRMKSRLPNEAEESIIKRVNPFSHPVMIISVTGSLDLATMTELCEEIVKKKLDKTDGVATITISGGQEREILVEVDRDRLKAHQVSLTMVVDALKNANYDYPAGTTQSKVVEYLIRTYGRFTKVADIEKTIVRVENPEIDPLYKWKKRETRDHMAPSREQQLITLSSLAEIKMSLKDRTSYSRYNGRENISISIQKQAEANTVNVSKSVREALDELKVSLPKSMELKVIYDESDYIVSALSNMRNNVLIGGILAFFVLLYFLGQFRDAVNVGMAIPVSILASLIMMYLFGLSINMLTLAGLALAVGTLSDSAIVVTENVARHHSQYKKSLFQSAIDGANQMVPSMITAALTNIAVFLPLLFITGIAQQLFQDLFVVTVFTALAGLFVSLTLIPRMSAYEWKIPAFIKMPGFLKIGIDKQKAESMNQFYKKLLTSTLDHPAMVIQILIGFVALAAFVVYMTPRVFMPKIDQGQFIVELGMPIGTRLGVTNSVAGRLEQILSGFEKVNVMVNVGSAQEEEDIDALRAHEAQLVVTLEKDNDSTTNEVIDKFKAQVSQENLEGGHLTYLLQDSPLRSAIAGGAPIEVEIKGPDLTRLKYFSQKINDELEADKHFYGTKSTFGLPSRETKVVVDKDRAAGYQLSVADIAKTALIAIRGIVATKFKEGGKETDIRVRLRKQDRNNREVIRQMALRSPRGIMIPLDAVAKIKAGFGASEIHRKDQQRAVVITSEVSGITTGKALKKVAQIISKYQGMKDYTVELGGESRRMAESYRSMKYTFLLAIILIYMIMAAEFESLIQPFVIMLTVPFAFVGIAFTLFITNTPLSAVVGLGMVILAGLVVNNGIVLIDHMNHLRTTGLSLREAVIKGSQDRFRPIIITSITTILAVLPLAIGLGRGDDLAQPMAVVTFGGMFVSTLLTILVIPLVYYKIQEDKREVAS